jgi:hypothetical protein
MSDCKCELNSSNLAPLLYLKRMSSKFAKRPTIYDDNYCTVFDLSGISIFVKRSYTKYVTPLPKCNVCTVLTPLQTLFKKFDPQALAYIATDNSIPATNPTPGEVARFRSLDDHDNFILLAGLKSIC